MRKELIEEETEAKWKELNMGIDQWKHKYLYPFGKIAPIQSESGTESTAYTSVIHDSISQI